MFDPDFDGQKLMYHPDRVAQWLAEGKTSGPLYTELEISNRCNCRCLFCGVDHLVNGTGTIMPPELAAQVFDGLAELGNRSVMICGNGEPLLNPDVVEIVRMAAGRMSVSMTTNGIVLSTEKLPLIDDLEWIRFSINGYDPENYGLVHGTGEAVFEKVLDNISNAVSRKKELGLEVTIGTQLVLLPENESGVVELARRLKEIGVDYFSIKPYSQHPLSRNRRSFDYQGLLDMEERLRPLEGDGFSIIFRAAAMQRAGTAKSYRSCRGIHFIAFITADGAVWECNVFAGDERFAVGRVGEQTLPEIWHGSARKRVVDYIEHDFDLGQCRDLCRMDACNRYLWRLRHPWPHDNFI